VPQSVCALLLEIDNFGGGGGLEFNTAAFNTQTVLNQFKMYKLKIIPGL
jgi:hypothetical protein